VTPPPVPPFLFVDLYPFDLDDPRTKVIEDPPWPRALAHEKLTGVILKATDGMRYGFTRWFTRNFATLVQLLGERRGHTFLLGGYHYLQFLEDGSAQADVYVHALWEAGWGALDIVPIVDVEFGSKPGAANQKATTQQIIDTTSAFAERCRALTGRGVMLYGRGAMRDRSIQSKMGCDRVWDPSYTEKLVTNGIAGKLPNGKQAPWTLDDIALWQYGGDGDGNAATHHLPLALEGFGKVDLSVYIDGSKKPTVESMLRRLR
jgi:GH25 family lysozyme M1 (1,4-beta-N-acetylmuramidase)